MLPNSWTHPLVWLPHVSCFRRGCGLKRDSQNLPVVAVGSPDWRGFQGPSGTPHNGCVQVSRIPDNSWDVEGRNCKNQWAFHLMAMLGNKNWNKKLDDSKIETAQICGSPIWSAKWPQLAPPGVSFPGQCEGSKSWSADLVPWHHSASCTSPAARTMSSCFKVDLVGRPISCYKLRREVWNPNGSPTESGLNMLKGAMEPLQKWDSPTVQNIEGYQRPR